MCLLILLCAVDGPVQLVDVSDFITVMGTINNVFGSQMGRNEDGLVVVTATSAGLDSTVHVWTERRVCYSSMVAH